MVTRPTDCNESLKGYYEVQSEVKQIANISSLSLWIKWRKVPKLEELPYNVLGEEGEQ